MKGEMLPPLHCGLNVSTCQMTSADILMTCLRQTTQPSKFYTGISFLEVSTMLNLKENRKLVGIGLVASLVFSLLTACGASDNKTDGKTDGNPNTTGGTTVSGNECFSTNSLGINKLPESSTALYKTTFCKYLGLATPNGKSIGFYAQEKVTDEQLIRAQRILSFYLQGKDSVANHMADNNALMLLFNGADGDIEIPEDLQGQPLYEKEMITEGSLGYLSSDLETYRDASFEEILHLMHDYGIGTESQAGADMAFSTQVKEARENAMAQSLWPASGARSKPRDSNWIEELRKEGSLSQEYLASVLDSYYGLWQGFSEPGGMWGIYSAKSRADIQSQDPLGYAVMQSFFQPNLTYMARIDSEFNGTFSMQLDSNQAYTYKSQYLTHARLTGALNSNLKGNTLDNQLAGNSGSNVLDGADGSDTALMSGHFSEYSIQKNSSGFLIQDSINNRDGSIEIRNIEVIKFKDKGITTSSL
jgi:hypothetical protein